MVTRPKRASLLLNMAIQDATVSVFSLEQAIAQAATDSSLPEVGKGIKQAKQLIGLLRQLDEVRCAVLRCI